MAHPPSAADATQREKEKGLSGKGKADSLREPSNSQDAAIAAVKKYLRDPFVTANLPSLEAIETAVAAELVEAGSGRKIIQSAANDTWKAKRTA
jgi:hypothetical protein